MKDQFEFKMVQEPSCRYHMPYLRRQLGSVFSPTVHVHQFIEHLVVCLLQAGMPLELGGLLGKITASVKDTNLATISTMYPNYPFHQFRPTWAAYAHGWHGASVDFRATDSCLHVVQCHSVNENNCFTTPLNFSIDQCNFGIDALFSNGSSSSWWQPLHRDLRFLWHFFRRGDNVLTLSLIHISEPTRPY